MTKSAKPAPAASTIQLETNDAVQPAGLAPVESVTYELGGLTVETFVGVQTDLAWAEPKADAE